MERKYGWEGSQTYIDISRGDRNLRTVNIWMAADGSYDSHWVDLTLDEARELIVDLMQAIADSEAHAAKAEHDYKVEKAREARKEAERRARREAREAAGIR